jgi:hypothetical protein
MDMAFPNSGARVFTSGPIAAAIVAAAALASGLSAQTQPRQPAKSPAVTQTKPTGAAPAAKSASPANAGDAALEATIRAKFAKSKIDADRFQVRVQGGVATIEGSADVLQHKGVATRLARTAGARAVNNNIQVSDAARQKASRNLEAGRRRVQVKRSDPRNEATEKQKTTQ